MNKTWKKCVLLFLVVFVIIFVLGTTSINFLDDVAMDHHIHLLNGNVTDKYYGDTFNEDYYVVVINNDKVLSVKDTGDGYGKKMWNSIQVGQEYAFIVKEPELTDMHPYTHILQVENVNS